MGSADFTKYGITFYPNPVEDILTFSGDSAIDDVAVYSLPGQMLMYKQMHQNEQFIDMTQFVPGAYFVSVKSGDRTATIRIIKR